MTSGSNLDYATGLARAAAGALIFVFPLVMTMEMWSIGVHIASARLLLFLALGVVMLVGLAHFSGLRTGGTWMDALLDGLTAYAAGFLTVGVAMVLLGIITTDYGWRGAVGMVAIQSVPAGIGAAVARKQLGAAGDDEDEDKAGYAGQLFLMGAGAVFLAFNVAPTEEMMLITYGLSPWQAVALMAVSIGLLHALVYTVGFAGQEQRVGGWIAFLTYTVAGYALALALSGYVLWTFGYTDGASLDLVAMMAVVLAFPSSLGAGLARVLV